MSLRTDLADLDARVQFITRNAIDALTRSRNEVDACDSLPTHVIGASAPTAGPAVIYGGFCQEWVNVGGLEGHEERCGKDRPCPDHDSTVGLTPTEAAGRQLAALAARHEALTKAIAKLIGAAKHAEIEVNRHLDRPDSAPLLCTRGLGTDTTTAHEGAKDCRQRGCTGCTPWTDPNCRRPTDRACGDLCEPCHALEQTWRINHGLDPIPRVTVCYQCNKRPATDGRRDGICDACRKRESRERINEAS